MTTLQAEAVRLSDEKPEEAEIIQDKIVQMKDLWQDLNQMVL